MLYSQFFNFVETFDILGIQESKTDDTDNICIQGYQLFYNNREKLSMRRSGGKYLLKIIFAHYINVDDTILSKLIPLTRNYEYREGYWFWSRVQSTSPHGSKFASDDPYLELQTEILRYCPSSDQIVMMGNFNSRTREKDEFCFIDDRIPDEFGLQTLADESKQICYLFSQIRQNHKLLR